MEARKKIAVFIDYSLRVPNFKTTYDLFKQELFTDAGQELRLEEGAEQNDLAFYWSNQIKLPDVEKFYLSKTAPEDDMNMCGIDMSKYFFNEEHYTRFMDEFSFNLYVDCKNPLKKDIDLINIAQQKLFDVTLVDTIRSRRKIINTFFFLSKSTIFPQSVLFLSPGQNLNPDNYIGIWNPSSDDKQRNIGDNMLEWLMALEKQIKCIP